MSSSVVVSHHFCLYVLGLLFYCILYVMSVLCFLCQVRLASYKIISMRVVFFCCILSVLSRLVPHFIVRSFFRHVDLSLIVSFPSFLSCFFNFHSGPKAFKLEKNIYYLTFIVLITDDRLI